MTANSDEQLLIYIKEGDTSAFAELVKRHSQKFYHLAYRYTTSQEEAEDITQLAFLKLWENPYKWQPERGAKFLTWFYRVVVNLCLDKNKKKKSTQLADYHEIVDDRNNQEDSAIKNEQQKLLEIAISKLPNRQKTALILCFYEEVSNKEAAQIMKVSLQSLQSLLIRAKQSLKKSVQDINRGYHE